MYIKVYRLNLILIGLISYSNKVAPSSEKQKIRVGLQHLIVPWNDKKLPMNCLPEVKYINSPSGSTIQEMEIDILEQDEGTYHALKYEYCKCFKMSTICETKLFSPNIVKSTVDSILVDTELCTNPVGSVMIHDPPTCSWGLFSSGSQIFEKKFCIVKEEVTFYHGIDPKIDNLRLPINDQWQMDVSQTIGYRKSHKYHEDQDKCNYKFKQMAIYVEKDKLGWLKIVESFIRRGETDEICKFNHCGMGLIIIPGFGLIKALGNWDYRQCTKDQLLNVNKKIERTVELRELEYSKIQEELECIDQRPLLSSPKEVPGVYTVGVSVNLSTTLYAKGFFNYYFLNSPCNVTDNKWLNVSTNSRLNMFTVGDEIYCVNNTIEFLEDSEADKYKHLRNVLQDRLNTPKKNGIFFLNRDLGDPYYIQQYKNSSKSDLILFGLIISSILLIVIYGLVKFIKLHCLRSTKQKEDVRHGNLGRRLIMNPEYYELKDLRRVQDHSFLNQL